jgi:DNA-binding MarR family transcriptional regulator
MAHAHPPQGAEPRWLSDEERQAWIGLVALMTVLPPTIEAPLRQGHQFMLFEYHALAMLSESPERTLPLKALARLTNGSLSRLSHVLDRLETRGLLMRRPSTQDGRVTEAVLTDAGFAALAEAAPCHVATVRQLVIDVLTPDQVDQLADITGAVLGRLGLDIPGADTGRTQG